MNKKILNNLSLIQHSIKSMLLSSLSFFVKRKKNRIAFGSWVGERYVDNSRYLAEYITKNYPDYEVIWVGKEKIRDEIAAVSPSITFCPINHLKTDLTLLTCKYMFCSQGIQQDISGSNVFRGATTCYLHHGMPLKRWNSDAIPLTKPRNKGFSERLFDSFRNSLKKLCGDDLKYDYFVISSKLQGDSYLTALKDWGFTKQKEIKSGTPRNDMFFHLDSFSPNLFKKRYCKEMAFESGKRVIMYLPTFRRNPKHVFSFSTISAAQKEKIESILRKYNAIIIEKSHFAERITFETKDSAYIKYADRNVNVQEMLLFTNCLISDYSGAFLDFIILDRPIIHFAYDYEYYRDEDSGLYYDIEDFSAGPIAKTFDELCDQLESILIGNDTYREKRQYVLEKYMGYEHGNASEIIFHEVVLKNNAS